MNNYLIVYSYEPSGMWMSTPDIRYGNKIVQTDKMTSEKINEIVNSLVENVSTSVTIHNIIKLDD